MSIDRNNFYHCLRLSRFEKTNEMLSNCCQLSSTRLDAAKKELTQHTQTIIEMRKDLQSIFRRVRTFKQTLAERYPQTTGVYDGGDRVDRKIPMEGSPTTSSIVVDFFKISHRQNIL